jgi:peptidoglycan hydrolase CwlO-like protein
MSQHLTPKQIFKMWVDRFVSIGAAVVIIGALFKILHWKFANELLIVGMFTEAGIFLIYALLPQEIEKDVKNDGIGGSSKLDSTELINALHEVKLSIENTNSSLHVISSSTNGLKELEAKFDAMGKTIDELNHFYGSLKNVSETISSSVGEAARTKDQLSALANNLTELNAIYSNMIHAIKGK